MSDFLDNLVARSFQPAAAIQPLAASRFAPVMDTPRTLASAAAPDGEMFEDPFAPPVVDDLLAQEAEPTALPRVRLPRSGVQTASPVEDQHPPPAAEPQTPKANLPRRAATSLSAEPIIEPRTPAAGHRASPPADPMKADAPKPDQVAPVRGTEPLPVGTSRPHTIRRAEPAAHDGELIRPAVRPQPAIAPLAAIAAANQPPPAIQRENGIVPRQKLSPRPAETSLAARDHLPASPTAAERVIIEQVTEVVETAEEDARMTLIPKPIAKPPLASNLNVRPKPRPQTQSLAPAPAPPETIVNVTIGRIEVRATPPLRTGAKPERQHNSAPVMGLDEYQRQRNGGSR